LIKNAAEATPGDVCVTLGTIVDSDRILLSVSDNGPGIPPENLSHIFDPFFSTKRAAGGTGLGLSVCHGIVSDHGGTISVQSKVREGTRFTIELPLAAKGS